MVLFTQHQAYLVVLQIACFQALLRGRDFVAAGSLQPNSMPLQVYKCSMDFESIHSLESQGP